MSKMLFVVDMQRDFCYPDGKLYNENCQKVIPYVVDRIKSLVKEDKLIFTLDSHFAPSYNETIEGKNLPLHCTGQGSWLIDEVEDAFYANRNIRMIPYNTVSKQTFMVMDIQSKGDITTVAQWTDEIEICGILASICVISNALMLRSMFPKKKIIIYKQAIADLDDEKLEAAITVMKQCFIDVIE